MQSECKLENSPGFVNKDLTMAYGFSSLNLNGSTSKVPPAPTGAHSTWGSSAGAVPMGQREDSPVRAQSPGKGQHGEKGNQQRVEV